MLLKPQNCTDAGIHIRQENITFSGESKMWNETTEHTDGWTTTMQRKCKNYMSRNGIQWHAGIN